MEKKHKIPKNHFKAETPLGSRILSPRPFDLKASLLSDFNGTPKSLDEKTSPYEAGKSHSQTPMSKTLKLLSEHTGKEREEIAIRMIEGWGNVTLAGLDQDVVQALTEILTPKSFGKKMPKVSKNGSTPQAKALKKLQNARSLDYLLSDKSGELKPSQINFARKLITQVSETEKDKHGKVQGDYWEQLQGKAAYVNQRDVRQVFGEETFFSRKTGIKSQVGGTCNLASLAMSLSFLGVYIRDLSNEFPNMPKAANDTEKLELIRLSLPDSKRHDRTLPLGWGNVANELGANVTDIGEGVHKKAWWEEKIRNAHLRKGHAVMCSIEGERGSHIVRIQAITNEGIIVDDPIGKSVPQAGKTRTEPDSINKSTNGAQSNDIDPWIRKRTNNDGKVGSDHLWPWRAVEGHHFKWIRAIVRQ